MENYPLEFILALVHQLILKQRYATSFVLAVWCQDWIKCSNYLAEQGHTNLGSPHSHWPKLFSEHPSTAESERERSHFHIYVE